MPTKYEEHWRNFWLPFLLIKFHLIPSYQTRRLALRVSTGSLKDIVSAYSKIKTLHQDSNTGRFLKFSYLKTHVNMVISKNVLPHPNLTSNFKTHQNVGGNFYFVYINIIHVIYSHKVWRTLKDAIDYRPKCSIKLGTSRLAVSVSTGHLRDIVVALSKIKTPHQNSTTSWKVFWNSQKIVYKLLLYMISVNFWNQIFENSREYGNFENGVTPPLN